MFLGLRELRSNGAIRVTFRLARSITFNVQGFGALAAVFLLRIGKGGILMFIEIDFNSDEALYLQLRNQIILGIATDQFHEGESLPSVRSLADIIGINMHTVNKAYTLLKQEGYVKVDRRKGAVIAVDANRALILEEIRRELQVTLAKSCCKNVPREEIHNLVDEIYDGMER